MNSKGYTLIELLIALTVITILFSVGYSNYRDFSRRQALIGAAKIVQGDLRKAQQNALSGVKPSGCDTLDGYNFFIRSVSNYEIQAKCTNSSIVTSSITMTSGITISTTTNPVTFNVLGTGTNVSGEAVLTLTQTGTGNTTTVRVGSGGEIK